MNAVKHRIMSKVAITDAGCWEFQGCRVRGGYGQIRLNGKGQLVHRVMYELNKGPIPEGLQIDHLCRNRACCNPEHLEAVTLEENAARTLPGLRGQYRAAIERSKTHCPRGHEYSEENTYRNVKGYRWCRACRREKYAERKVS